MSSGDDSYIKRYEPLWGSWHIDSLIGEGSFGRVYRIYREEWGFRYLSALKLVKVPTREQYREAAAVFGSSGEQLYGYFQDAVKGIINEIQLMYTLKGNSSIISYEDHLVEKVPGDIGWDILIRMELATPLTSHVSSCSMSAERVIRLGMDICSALEACSKKGIIHRDIKDENIFISDDGCFKLGDFGIARVLSESSRAASMKGTPIYMAPEIYRGESYDARADIYSLGIVLYKLLNYGRMPFLPPYPEEIKYRDSEAALEKRMSGMELPCPQQAGDGLSSVIARACSFDRHTRFSSASEMKKALEEILGSMPDADRVKLLEHPKFKPEICPPYPPAPAENVKTGTSMLFSSIADTVILKAPASGAVISGNDISEGVTFEADISVTQTLKAAPGNRLRGNSPGNLANGGLFSLQGPFIYYSTPSICKGIFKMKPDGSGRTRLSDDSAWFINVSGPWLYFSNPDNEDRICRMKTDGSGKAALCNDRCWDINVVGDWIYYSSESDEYRIYRVKTDGSCNTRLCSDRSGSLCVSGGLIYYSNKDDSGCIYKISTDGHVREKVFSCEADCINVADSWIYYCVRSSPGIFRVKTDGSCNTRLCSDHPSNINVAGDWVYYCSKSENGRLYRMMTDGSTRMLLNNDSCDYISVLENSIFYSSKTNQGRFCRTGITGGTPDLLDNEADNSSEDEYILL